MGFRPAVNTPLWQNDPVETIAIFHSVLGLRAVEQEAAERFRSCGFRVVLPDLYAGRRTESLDEGFQVMAEIGWPMICRRAAEAMRNLPDTSILAGFSMGAGVISSLWRERPASRGVLLFHGLAEVPRNVRSGFRVQTHIASVDRFVSGEQRALWSESGRKAGLSIEDFSYSEAGHFFTDFNSTDYDAAASELAWKRALKFLHELSLT
ncbi:dienelactone hydrolase family protein [Occallatibacter riparius]|uniref:Dienelactone hydrolase family protein n=1 Tax=Occallatibacter riparius TaxID=1002689 RepID=A0A9J7BZ82_9BACT|nr:dienelactone hydrolase family protein [Occallatibacter riparius]UWZ86918.1 dienelactone hydrolase family protein [Occallatibacter riparius]